MSFLSKILFIWKKQKIIIVTGNGRKTTAEAVFCLLKKNFRVKKLSEKFPNILDCYNNEILILETDLKKSTRPPSTEPKAMSGEAPVEKFKFLVRKSQLPILLVTQVGDIPSAAHSGEPRLQSGRDKDFFAGEKKDVAQIRKIAKALPTQGYLILSFDDETVREIKDYNPPTVPSHILTFGFQEGADFQATDIKLNTQAQPPDEAGRRVESKKIFSSPPSLSLHESSVMNECSSTNDTNFKINYKGNIVPIWLVPTPNLGLGVSKEQIYPALGAIVVGTVLGLNLVEISNILKNYPFLSEEIKASTCPPKF